jgi:hypothetical protein
MSWGLGLFVVALILSWGNSAVHVALSDRPLYIRTLRVFRGSAPGRKVAAMVAATLGFLGLIAAFVADFHLEWTALAIVASLAAIRRLEIRQWPSDIVVRLGKYVPSAACLLAWLVSQPILRALGFDQQTARHLGWNSSCGVLAGAYVLAAIAKVRESGWSWMHPRYQALLVAERAYAGLPVFRGIRTIVASSRPAAAVIGFAGFATELAAIAFVVPSARPAVVALVILLHAGFLVLLGYFEPEWVLAMIAVTLLAG